MAGSGRKLGSVAASRRLHIHPHPPSPPTPTVSFNNPVPPSFVSYTTNYYKINDEDAFRPTSPGHSPGVGHKAPPKAP
ncbi:copper amine oxidase family protein [Senna tora]|uniref:Copper amine oxidase family protein n=1 Tax=Senna tora TaxID=362788 RepID=A0A834WTI0_9FABA|nr:copper amine oxidase family protein [Senna tora]